MLKKSSLSTSTQTSIFDSLPPAGAHKIGISKTIGKTTYTLSFPLCDVCGFAKSKIEKRRKVGCFTTLGLSIFFCAIGMIIYIFFKAKPGTFLYGAASVLLLLSTFTFFSGFIVLWLAGIIGVDPDVRRTYKRVSKAVKMINVNRGFLGLGRKSFTFRFTNDQFADLFKQLNSEVILSG
jgi:hypothetical protein